MLFAFWSPKGGSGTSVVATATAMVLAQHRPTRLADLAGDLPAILGVPPEPRGGLRQWLATSPVGGSAADLEALGVDAGSGLTLLPLGAAGPVAPVMPEAGAALAVVLADGVQTVLDAGRADDAAGRAAVEVADLSVLVVRACYLALRRAVQNPLTARAAGVVLVEEPGRTLGDDDVAELLERPVLARVPVRASVARAVDAGILSYRLPGPLLVAAQCLVASLTSRVAGRAA